MQIEVPKGSTNYIFAAIIVVLVLLVSYAAANTAFVFDNHIFRGVSVGNIYVGGLSPEEAEQKIASEVNKLTEQPVLIITYQNQSWPVAAADIDLVINAGNLAGQAYNVGRTGSIFMRIHDRYLALDRGYSLPLTVSYNQQKLQDLITGIAKTIDGEAHSAQLLRHGASFSIKPEIIGHKTQIPEAVTAAATALATQLGGMVTLPVQEVTPAIVADDLKNIDGILASYTTRFNSADANRTQNINLAARSIDDILVRSGETFSFNTHVGPRLEKYGYKEAPVFIDGKLVPDWGGGVCQVSSTLYNAVLLADMDIVERTSHFRPPGYVPLGQDATVADNQLDFKFKNNSPYNIYVISEVAGNELTVYLLGHLLPDQPSIQVVSEKKVIKPNVITKPDPTLEQGKEVVESAGQLGYQVTTYRLKYVNGNMIAREYLSFDDFPPEDRVVRIGTKMPPVNVVPPTNSANAIKTEPPAKSPAVPALLPQKEDNKPPAA